MHELNRSGELCATADQLARAARCSTVELVQALTDLQTTGAADVTLRNGAYVVRNRRMFAESQKRKSNAERQIRYRNKDCNGDSNANVSLSDNDTDVLFEKFWEEFPKGRKKSKAPAREAFLKALCKTDAETLIAAAKQYAASPQGLGKYVQMPSSWLNQECWADDRQAWQDRDRAAEQGVYIEVGASQFLEYFRLGKFKEKPIRHATKPNWVFGMLRDGTKVECRNYQIAKSDGE